MAVGNFGVRRNVKVPAECPHQPCLLVWQNSLIAFGIFGSTLTLDPFNEGRNAGSTHNPGDSAQLCISWRQIANSLIERFIR
jgi:hypothetical protein